MEEDVSDYESTLAKNDRIDALEQEISTETEQLLEGLKEEERQILLRYYAAEDDVDVLAKEYGVSPDDKIILRGIVLNRITSPEVRKLFQDDRSRYFRAESFCAMEALQHHRERQLAASV